MLGEIYSRENQRERALSTFLKADSLNPGNGKINYNLGVLYYEWDKITSAKEYFIRSIKYEDYLDSHLYLGAIYKEEGNYKKALERFRYRVLHKTGEDDLYAYQAMNGIKLCLEALKQN
jgi:tetratricopeptide (TPR) repeat protein